MVAVFQRWLGRVHWREDVALACTNLVVFRIDDVPT